MNRTSLVFLTGCLGGLAVALVLMAGCGGGGGAPVVDPCEENPALCPQNTGVIEGFIFVPARSGPALSRQVITGGVPLQAGSTVELWDISDPDHPVKVATTQVTIDGQGRSLYRFENVPVGAGKIYEIRAMGTVAGETVPRQLRAVVPEPSLDAPEVSRDLSAETTAAADAIKEMVKEGTKPDLDAMAAIEAEVQRRLEAMKADLADQIRQQLLDELGIDPDAISADEQAQQALAQLVNQRLDPTINLTDEEAAKEKVAEKAQELIQTIAQKTGTTVNPTQVAATAQNAANQAIQTVKEETDLANPDSLVNQAVNAKTGTLIISSDPDQADIYLYGALVVRKKTGTEGSGEARFEKTTEGQIPVRVSKTGYKPVSVKINGVSQNLPDPNQPVLVLLNAGETVTVHFTLQTVSVGNLEVSSDIDQPLAVPPIGAAIFLNGQAMGKQTPSLFTGLPVGDHEVKLWYAKRTVTLTATVRQDQTTSVKGLFVAELTVNTDIGADVTVQGPVYTYGPEKAANGWLKFRLLAGDGATYRVTSKLGGRTVSGEVTLKGGDKKTMTLKHGQGVVITP